MYVSLPFGLRYVPESKTSVTSKESAVMTSISSPMESNVLIRSVLSLSSMYPFTPVGMAVFHLCRYYRGQGDLFLKGIKNI